MLRFVVGAILYLSLSSVSPLALVAAALGLLLASQRPAPFEALLAALLLGFAGWSVVDAVRAGDGFARVEASWICLFIGGLVVALAVRPPAKGGVLGTALVAVAISAVAGSLLVALTAFSWDELRFLSTRHFEAETQQMLASVAQLLGNSDRSVAMVTRFESGLGVIVDYTARLLPALILVQSVLATAAGWALYRGIARHPEGEPLPKLRELRFSDHLIWGVVFALILLVFPGARALRDVGGNVATFFGALYVARGLGIVAALSTSAGLGAVLVGFIGLIMTVVVPYVTVFGALALGVTDTWVDWRRITKPKT